LFDSGYSIVDTPLEPWVNLFANKALDLYSKENAKWNEALKVGNSDIIADARERMAQVAQDFGYIVREKLLSDPRQTETKNERIWEFQRLAGLSTPEERSWMYLTPLSSETEISN